MGIVCGWPPVGPLHLRPPPPPPPPPMRSETYQPRESVGSRDFPRGGGTGEQSGNSSAERSEFPHLRLILQPPASQFPAEWQRMETEDRKMITEIGYCMGIIIGFCLLGFAIKVFWPVYIPALQALWAWLFPHGFWV